MLPRPSRSSTHACTSARDGSAPGPVNPLIAKRPDDVRKFLAGWFESAVYFKTHKEEAVKFTAQLLKRPEPIISRVFDEAEPMITTNGHFDAKGLAAIRQSLVDTKILPAPPDMSKLYTEKFLPN